MSQIGEVDSEMFSSKLQQHAPDLSILLLLLNLIYLCINTSRRGDYSAIFDLFPLNFVPEWDIGLYLDRGDIYGDCILFCGP